MKEFKRDMEKKGKREREREVCFMGLRLINCLFLLSVGFNRTKSGTASAVPT
jgi:hypothetical protein